MTFNMFNRSVIRRCSDFLALVEALRAYLLIPDKDKEKLQISWD